MKHHEHLDQADRLIADCLNRTPGNARSSQLSMKQVSPRMWPSQCCGNWRKACVPWKSIGNSSSIRKKGGPTMTGKNWIMIFGPNPDGTYVVEFRTAKGETLVISVPCETRVLKHFQQRMPYGFRARDKGGVSVMAG
jgi:hypothetical protein